jgi:very-short-patch-repair endonuclease
MGDTRDGCCLHHISAIGAWSHRPDAQLRSQSPSNLTDAECLLWSRLRRRQLAGFKFRRQHMIGPYICDFVCPKAAVIIELDGSQHLDAASYDLRRDNFLRERGFRVLRFWNALVLSETDSVIETIFEVIHRKEMDRRLE